MLLAMAESTQWAFPPAVQPTAENLSFDLKSALDAVVLLRAEIPEDAFTASTLGTERSGNGVVIRSDGLILTIGYLITEAETIWLTLNEGTTVPGHALARSGDRVRPRATARPCRHADARPRLRRGDARRF
jgi:S1-C subfamily serine protease